jgi:hypothetical protein
MGDFDVVRQRTIAAPADRVHALIEDFHQWRHWSPWEDLDPELHREYSGPDKGVGARYAWQGNRKAGKGEMEITGSSRERVDVRLVFFKPMKATNHVTFELRPAGRQTEVAWRMRGTTRGPMALFSKVVPMDRLVGKDFVDAAEQDPLLVLGDPLEPRLLGAHGLRIVAGGVVLVRRAVEERHREDPVGEVVAPEHECPLIAGQPGLVVPRLPEAVVVPGLDVPDRDREHHARDTTGMPGSL